MTDVVHFNQWREFSFGNGDVLVKEHTPIPVEFGWELKATVIICVDDACSRYQIDMKHGEYPEDLVRRQFRAQIAQVIRSRTSVARDV